MREAIQTDGPKICLSLTEPTLRENLAVVERQRRLVDLVELRVDMLAVSDFAQLSRFPDTVGLPAILSFRRKEDGGAREVEERTRLAILDRALTAAWGYLDLEGDLNAPWLDEKAARLGVPVIRSLHDFRGVPPNLASVLRGFRRSPTDLLKAQVTPHSVRDLLSLLDAAGRIAPLPAILVGMGEWGFLSRILPARFSSILSYCSVGQVKAAGEPIDPETLRRVYRFGEISAGSRLYCVIGNPVMHSRSPWIHNPALRALGLDAVYVPIQVDSLPDFLTLAERLSIAGASVTVPHKESVRACIGAEDPSVHDAGACNTLVRGPGGWKGYNTDINGFMAPLAARFATGLAERRVLVIGAGGAARAVVAGLVGAGCRVSIVNRTARRAADLAANFGCDWVGITDLASRANAEYEIVVQATSVGMTPNEENDPLPDYHFRGSETVYDLVYSPADTRFLQRAQAAGCDTIGGREMLLHQAYAQFRLFTGYDYPRDVSVVDF